MLADPPPAVTQTKDQQKVAALEQAIAALLKGSRYDGDMMANRARVIVDLLDDEMTAEEQDAAWLLIRYAKRREAEIRRKEDFAQVPTKP